MAANLSVPQVQPQGQSELSTEQSKLFSDWEKSQQGVEQAYQKTEPAVQQARGEVMKGLQEPTPAAPQLKEIPQFEPRVGTQQDINAFAGILSFFGAIASLRTRDPLASALNAAGSAMEGLNKGQLQRANLDFQEFNKKLDSAVAENRKMLDQYTAIITDRKLSQAQKESMLSVATAAREDEVGHALLVQHGIEGLMKRIDTLKNAQDQLETRRLLMKQNFEFKLAELDLKQKEEARKSAGGGQKGWQLMVDKEGRVWRYNVNTNAYEPADLPPGAQKMPPSGKPSMSEEKMSVQYADMSFNENTIKELAAKGTTTLPVSTQVWGKMIDPTTGNVNASVQKSIRDHLSTPEEKMLWDASVGFVIAYAHAISGARLNENQLMVIWNSRVPMDGDSPEEVAYKQKMRDNDLLSVIRGTGTLRPELEKAGGTAGPKEGDTSKSKSGKPIVFRDGAWHYAQ